MATQDFFDNNVGAQDMDVSASTRIFQTSIVLKQDKDKSGILSFLKTVESSSPSQPRRTNSPSQRPTRREGGY